MPPGRRSRRSCALRWPNGEAAARIASRSRPIKNDPSMFAQRANRGTSATSARRDPRLARKSRSISMQPGAARPSCSNPATPDRRSLPAPGSTVLCLPAGVRHQHAPERQEHADRRPPEPRPGEADLQQDQRAASVRSSGIDEDQAAAAALLGVAGRRSAAARSWICACPAWNTQGMFDPAAAVHRVRERVARHRPAGASAGRSGGRTRATGRGRWIEPRKISSRTPATT